VQCEVKQWCRRWQERDSREPHVLHGLTLRHGWECFDEYCINALPADVAEVKK
jgi:hypothetical protein